MFGLVSIERETEIVIVACRQRAPSGGAKKSDPRALQAQKSIAKNARNGRSTRYSCIEVGKLTLVRFFADVFEVGERNHEKQRDNS